MKWWVTSFGSDFYKCDKQALVITATRLKKKQNKTKRKQQYLKKKKRKKIKIQKACSAVAYRLVIQKQNKTKRNKRVTSMSHSNFS